MNTTIEYTIAEHYLSYIINGDDSGLEPEEIEQVDDFLAHEQIGSWLIDLPDTEEGGQFARCEICGLYANCYTITATNLGG